MPSFEILCATMNQTDFSKIKEMNIKSNVVFANQAGRNEFSQIEFGGKTAKMVTTDTIGVGKNRNLSLIHASGDICLFADDDVRYSDDAEEKILKEFENHPDADVIIFHFESTNHDRTDTRYNKTKKRSRFSKAPWGCYRIAFKLDSIKKCNIWFTTLFGGGCIFPSGEDSMLLSDMKKNGMVLYTSKETIGTVSHQTSTWFTGYDEKFFYAKGVYYQATRPKTIHIWMLYAAIKFFKNGDLSFKKKLTWINHGKKGYKKMLSYDDFCRTLDPRK